MTFTKGKASSGRAARQRLQGEVQGPDPRTRTPPSTPTWWCSPPARCRTPGVEHRRGHREDEVGRKMEVEAGIRSST
ncbi:MAG: hypothetical protein MZV65_48575 [Chromatiales bacterium]|nr:hypothetical protein [Chromatiales bacterium]